MLLTIKTKITLSQPQLNSLLSHIFMICNIFNILDSKELCREKSLWQSFKIKKSEMTVSKYFPVAPSWCTPFFFRGCFHGNWHFSTFWENQKKTVIEWEVSPLRKHPHFFSLSSSSLPVRADHFALQNFLPWFFKRVSVDQLLSPLSRKVFRFMTLVFRFMTKCSVLWLFHQILKSPLEPHLLCLNLFF